MHEFMDGRSDIKLVSTNQDAHVSNRTSMLFFTFSSDPHFQPLIFHLSNLSLLLYIYG